MPARTVDRDGSDPRASWKLPRTKIPEPILPGIRGWQTSEGWTVLRLHYSADPERATKDWVEEQVQGYRGGTEGRDWRREMEIDFSAYKGEPVYAQFDAIDSVQATSYNPHLPLWRGWDFGYRHPAVVWVQLWGDGTLALLHELYPTLDSDAVPGVSTAQLAEMALAETERLFPQATDRNATAGVFDFCDPAGNQTKDTSEFSSIEILQQYGIDPEWSVVGRKSRIAYLRRHIEVPGRFRVNPHCTLSIKAISAAYRYPEEAAGGADREMPDLGKKVQEEPYIHVMDALEYVAACNLEIEWTMHSNHTEERRDIGDLAKMYLDASAANTRQDMTAEEALTDWMESGLEDLAGTEDDNDDFGDAFLLT